MSVGDLAETMENRVELLRNGGHNDIDVLRETLTSIAVEIQRFHDSTFDSESDVIIPGYKEKHNVFSELLKCKSKIKHEKNRIQKLRNNLKTACTVAKIVSASKESETEAFKKSLDSARDKCTDLSEKYRTNTETINNLIRENENLNSKYNNIANFIRLGYDELQKVRNENSEETTALEQLRQLIVCCGQYYADYCNEHDECLQLKSRNRFLTKKILILENNIEALSQQLKALDFRNFKLQKENERFKSCNANTNNIELEYSEVTLTRSSTRASSNDDDDDDSTRKIQSSDNNFRLDFDQSFDLSPHLSKVKKLLKCQDLLLKDLKSLSEEFLNRESVDELSS